MEFLKNKSIPYYYLYDDKGSEFYDEITKLQEYYPFKQEQELIDKYVNEMTNFDDDMNTDGVYLVEFGAGYSEKTEKYVLSLTEKYKNVFFVPIDVSAAACEVTRLKYQSYKNLQVIPFVGTYDMFLQENHSYEYRVIYLFLGSSIGNFERHDQISFLQGVKDNMNFRDIFLCGFDTNYKSPNVILNAYNDSSGTTAKFILNILNHLNEKFNLNCNTEDFIYQPCWNEECSRVEMSLMCKHTTVIKSGNDGSELTINAGEKFHIEYSHKFDVETVNHIAKSANLITRKVFMTENKYFMMCSMVKDCQEIWDKTNSIFNLIGQENFHLQPVDLRNKIIFYFGHIYAFYDIKVHNLPETDPYFEWFERGRDPMVTDPEICHRTSKVPDNYPHPDDIERYNTSVKLKTYNFIEKFGYSFNLLTAIEHELMHQETLFYIVRMMKLDIQTKTNFENYVLPETLKIKIPTRTIQQGTNETFVWDNEMPAHFVTVESFVVDNYPVTWRAMKSFIIENPDIFKNLLNLNEKMQIRVSELVWMDWDLAENFPAWVNLEVATEYIKWKNNQGEKCRLMTENEFDSLSSTLPNLKDGNSNFKLMHASPIGYFNDLSTDGIGELFGNGWELTESLFRPFEGFYPQKNYSEYSKDFFTDHHFVLKGASPLTPSGLLRKSFRNWFQYKYPYQLSKFRLVYPS